MVMELFYYISIYDKTVVKEKSKKRKEFRKYKYSMTLTDHVNKWLTMNTFLLKLSYF